MSREEKGTPGPWETIGKSGTALAVCAHNGGDIVAEVHTGNVADRDLIAAAPDMLEALEEAHAIIVEALDLVPVKGKTYAFRWEKERKRIWSIMQKAKGGQA